MPIKRCSDQKDISLEEFYSYMVNSYPQPYQTIAANMLQLVKLINETFTETLLWGLTSHDRLVLQNQDYSASDWFVIISNVGAPEFYFEYLMPIDTRPWDNAYVRGRAESITQAKYYLVIAMTESKGWAGNKELHQLQSRLT